MGRRIYDFNAYARAAGWQPAPKLEPKPIQRIPPCDPQQMARSAYFSDMLRAGWDDEDAHELTVERFAIADHMLIGAIRNEE